MSDKIQYAVSCTPTEFPAVEHGTPDNVLATEIGKTLGGNGEAEVSDYDPNLANEVLDADSQGYFNATVNYREAIDTVAGVDISSEVTASFVFIKNTGYTYDTLTGLGVALAKAVKVMIGTTLISVLDAGEAIVLKDDNRGLVCTGIHVQTVDLDGSDNASAGHLAVEFLVVD